MSDEADFPITISDKAAQKLTEALAAETGPPKAVRVSVKGGGCSGYSYGLDFSDAEPDDLEATIKGVRVVCDRMSAQYLTGTEIDYSDGIGGNAGFKFVNPNAKHTCGCGSSFST